MALSPPSPSGLRAPPLPLSRSSALLAHTERAITTSPLLPLDPSKTTIKHLLRGPPRITWRSRESSLKSCSHRFSSLAERLRIVSSLGPSPMDKRCRLGRYGALSLSRHRWYGYGEARKRVQTARARCTAGGKQATLHTQVRGIFLALSSRWRALCLQTAVSRFMSTMGPCRPCFWILASTRSHVLVHVMSTRMVSPAVTSLAAVIPVWQLVGRSGWANLVQG
ncbi:hypothetical protein CTAM01_11841 [Colletotrichum tamarilloi]|uniref:Uncharacterized protein n=1 Tax=Colletotrichum tamarilloi TaxID=1209934 RepID=A0ABQ9QWE5_9PEZI|nr:uncharacterized protein CTAM01_11841 [Colletotrichum tamarilloi]KAK1487384.1 hypothetical protein CTAM01_11841 [Colletotrichum tamarilloi]